MLHYMTLTTDGKCSKLVIQILRHEFRPLGTFFVVSVNNSSFTIALHVFMYV